MRSSIKQESSSVVQDGPSRAGSESNDRANFSGGFTWLSAAPSMGSRHRRAAWDLQRPRRAHGRADRVAGRLSLWRRAVGGGGDAGHAITDSYGIRPPAAPDH